MPNKVEITEPAVNIVEVSTSPITVEVTEQTNTVSVTSLTRAIGNATISSGIDITNTIGDALAGGTYSAGTTLESIVRDLIAPFLEPSISNMSFLATGTHQANGSQLLVECGKSASVTGVSLTLTNQENLKSGSDITVIDTSAQPNVTLGTESGIDPSSLSSSLTVSASYNVPIQTAPVARTIKASAVYLGDNGQGSDVTISRNTTIAHRHRMHVRASGTTLNNQVFNTWMTSGSSVYSTLGLDPVQTSQKISVSCNANTANSSNYTWIIIPSAATLEEVYAEVGGASIADYTDSFTLNDNSGNYWTHTVGTASPTYKVYRSNQTGAFDSDVTLKLTITH